MIEAGNAPTRAMCEPDLGTVDLAVAALAAQLANDFGDLGGTGRTDGMTLGQQTA